MTRADDLRAEHDTRVGRWASVDRTARIFPIRGGGAEVTLAGVDRVFPSVDAAMAEVRAMGLTPHLERFEPTPHVLAESP